MYIDLNSMQSVKEVFFFALDFDLLKICYIMIILTFNFCNKRGNV